MNEQFTINLEVVYSTSPIPNFSGWHPCYVMVCYVMLCHVMSCHVMSCHVMSCHVMSCHVMSCNIMSCNNMSCNIMSCNIMSCNIMSCHVMSCHVMSCHVMSCHVILCYAIFTSSCIWANGYSWNLLWWLQGMQTGTLEARIVTLQILIKNDLVMEKIEICKLEMFIYVRNRDYL